MPKGSSNIVHTYFKKEDEKGKTLLKVNPIHLSGIEIIMPNEGEPETNEIEIPQDYEAGLTAEGFIPCSPLEFNLYWSGLV